MKRNKKEVTIYDIAEELNVSATTVSRALNDHFSIGKETTLAVKKLAKEMGYRPNIIASGLRKNKTNAIGVIVSWIHRPFISSLISGIEEVADKAGYNVIISQSNDSFEKEITKAQTLYASRVDGLIVSLAMDTKSYNHFYPFQQNDIPLVFVDRVSFEMETDRVIINNFDAAFTATEHLINIGCKRIAHFAGAQHRNIYKERQDGYVEALKKHNLPIEENLILHSNLSMEEGWKGTEYLLNLSTPPDAIFSANDSAAVSAIQCAKEMGIKIPEELAVVGFNNDRISSIVEPALTTIGHPAIDMGKIAAQQVLKQKENKDVVESETIVLKTELIIRESSAGKAVKKK